MRPADFAACGLGRSQYHFRHPSEHTVAGQRYASAPIELDAAQVGRFAALIPDNSRPVQPLHDRTVLADTVR